MCMCVCVLVSVHVYVCLPIGDMANTTCRLERTRSMKKFHRESGVSVEEGEV
jgi:hypothetical protein